MPHTHAVLESMGQATRMTSKTRNRGYSVAELLIGLGLSSLVVVTALAVYQISRQSWQAMSAKDALYQNAIVAFRAIRRQAELDGAAYLIAGGDNLVTLSPTYPDTNYANDGLVLSHWSGVDPSDCQGNSSAGTNAIVSNSFKRNTNKELTCKDTNATGSSYQALAEGVEDLQTRFAQVNPILQTLQWVQASELFGSPHVVAVEVCLRLATPVRLPVDVRATSTSITGCRGETIAADGKLRRVFRQIFALRNRLSLYGQS